MMLVERAFEILDALKQLGEIDSTQEEQDELVSARLINLVTLPEYNDLRNAVRDLNSLTQKIRMMTRQKDFTTGPLGAVAGKGKRADEIKAREQFQWDLARLEETVGKKAILDSLVRNLGTGAYMSLTVVGRKTLSDLAVWRARFASLSLDVFLARMNSMRSSMESSVTKASSFVDDFMSPKPGMIKPELRGPALIAAENNINPEEFSNLLSRVPQSEGIEEHPEEDELFVSTYLASTRGGEEFLMSKYAESRASLRAKGVDMQNLDVAAASLTDLPPEDVNNVIDRMKWLKSNMVLPNDEDLAWLARSGYPDDVVKARYEALDGEVVKLGYQEDSNVRSACAIMAGSSYPIDALIGRFDKLASQLKYVFEAPQVAAAMLATSPMEPDEAIHVFKEAVGVVSRSNFFDDVGEVENLALILTHRIDPESPTMIETFSGGAIAEQQGVQSDTESERRSRRVPWYYWYRWNNRFYYQPIIHHVRTHPGHMHTVPYFG